MSRISYNCLRCWKILHKYAEKQLNQSVDSLPIDSLSRRKI